MIGMPMTCQFSGTSGEYPPIQRAATMAAHQKTCTRSDLGFGRSKRVDRFGPSGAGQASRQVTW